MPTWSLSQKGRGHRSFIQLPSPLPARARERLKYRVASGLQSPVHGFLIVTPPQPREAVSEPPVAI